MRHNKYVLEKFPNGMHYILLDAKTVKPFLKDNNKRVKCKLNNVHEFHCAIMPKKEGGFYINIGASICKKLKVKNGVIVEAIFSKDNEPYQFEMPEPLKVVLEDDRKAHEIFHALSLGKQRSLMYLVGLVKSEDKQIERALRIAEKIKAGVTSAQLILKK
jgi:Domain of unknown function (DUF1905)/Bacteriocin-protection, YdeI or OmpD-Associated